METDAPDALPSSNIDSLFFVEGDASLPEHIRDHKTPLTSGSSKDDSMLPKETLNHPANICNVCSLYNHPSCYLVCS